jgi:hypothetical protein
MIITEGGHAQLVDEQLSSVTQLFNYDALQRGHRKITEM